jgi:hypothetical protein
VTRRRLFFLVILVVLVATNVGNVVDPGTWRYTQMNICFLIGLVLGQVITVYGRDD